MALNFIKRVPTEVYSRVCGYFRPLDNWNKGKREEFAQRKSYALPKESPLVRESCKGEMHIFISQIRAVCTKCGEEIRRG